MMKKGHIFRSRTDTEVIIHLYEEYGMEFLKKMNGMFSLAIYDQRKNTILLARDRFGIKPLYYYTDRNKLIFASEIKAIVEDRSVRRDIDLDALYHYFSFGYVLPPMTIYKNIKQLAPSKYEVYRVADGALIGQDDYWKLKIQPEDTMCYADWKEKFNEMLSNSIRCRLVGDVPIGVFLSGGMDSSAIVSHLSREGTKEINTYSIGFVESGYDETKYSRLVAKKYSTNHHEYMVKPDALEIIDKLAWYYDEPLDDSSAIPTYYVSQLTGRDVKVVLTGDGGDELLAGYQRYRDFKNLDNLFRILPKAARKIFFANILKAYPESFRGKRRLYLLSLPTFESYREFMKNFNNSELPKLFLNDIYEQMDLDAEKDFSSLLSEQKSDLVTSLQYIDSRTYLPGDILTKVDRATMANSLEARSPFLDFELWEFVFKMPLDTRFRKNIGKFILKDAMKDEFGYDFVHREKMGFAVPLDYWFRGKLESFAKERLLGKRFSDRGIFDPQYVKRIFNIHSFGRRDFSRKIWSLLFFDAWARSWID
jgi:asparagine synthase (glutamine-hydrolysing)